MVALGQGLAASLAGLLALLGGLAATSGLGVPAATVGLGCGVVLAAAVHRGFDGTRAETLGPADLVTLTRATLSCGVAALVVEAAVRPAATGILVAIAATALVLDAVDGRVARRTGTTSRFGARFDGEADALLMLVLSVHVAMATAAWVLAIGAVRYVFGAGGSVWPWLAGALPPRPWRKVVAAVQGVVLTVAAAGIIPAAAAYAALVVALALLAESFGRDVWWLWRHRSGVAAQVTPTGLVAAEQP